MNPNILHLFATRDRTGVFLWMKRPQWCPGEQMFYNGGEVLTMSLWDGAFASRLGNVKALAGEVRELWAFLPAEKAGATLAWLGVVSPDHLAEANRSKLSQLRDRLLDTKAEAEAAKAAEPAPAPEAPPAAIEAPAVAPQVIVWTQDGCPRCAGFLDGIKAKGIEVEVRDVSRIEADRDSDAMAQLTMQNGALPVVWADGKFVDITAACNE